MSKRTLSCLFLSLLFVGSQAASTPVFTRITDSGNSIVTERLESGGACWVDVDGDGLLDLFVANGNLSNVNNSLHLNRGAAGFDSVTTGPVVTDGGSSIGGTFGDYNRDGYLDLFVTNRNYFGNFLYTGGAGGAFTRVTTGSPASDIANSNMSSWVDINNDGELDLFVINFQEDNYWYQNGGPPDYALTRIDTGSIVTDGVAFSIPGVWGDVNNDRLPDLYVGNAGNSNDVLHVNHGDGTFTAISMNDGRATIGAGWGDYDNDGNLDLVAAHFLNQNNLLYRNAGPPTYALEPIGASVVSTDGGNSVGTAWGDYDNDGDLDLFIANDGGNNALYENLGPPAYAFQKVVGQAATSDGGNSFGAVCADYDNDGDLDLFVANRLGQANFLYRNDTAGNGWLIVRCVGTTSNASGIGAKVRVKATIGGAPVWQMREVPAQTGYNAQNLLVHFGLGDAAVIESLLVEWPSGTITTQTAVPHSRYVTITEDATPPELPVGLNLDPDVLHLGSRAPYVTAYIEPIGFDPASIDPSTIRLAGVVPADPKFFRVGDHDLNDQPDLTVKFLRTDLEPYLVLGGNDLVITGSLVSGETFRGADDILVINPPESLPAASVSPNPLTLGGTLTVRTPSSGPVTVRLFDQRGRLLRTLSGGRVLSTGERQFEINGRGAGGERLPSGIYFFRAETAEGVAKGRLVLLK